MKTLITLLSLACITAAYADAIPYNLCADKTKTDCEVLHMPNRGQIDTVSGHKTFTCGAGCEGSASVKAGAAVALLVSKAGDSVFSNYITYEANPNNLVYIQPDQNANTYERIMAKQENEHLTLTYCTFATDNIATTLENYKKNHDNAQAGVAVLDYNNYDELKTAFQAQVDSSACEF